MVLQCVAVLASLYLLATASEESPTAGLAQTVQIILWATILLTLYSGAEYVLAAWRLAKKSVG